MWILMVWFKLLYWWLIICWWICLWFNILLVFEVSNYSNLNLWDVSVILLFLSVIMWLVLLMFKLLNVSFLGVLFEVWFWCNNVLMCVSKICGFVGLII